MLKKEDQGQSSASDHNTRSINHQNDKPQKPPCQRSKSHKKGCIRHDKQTLAFLIIYSVTFAALVMATLITQNYFLMPVINVMAMGLVSALYHAIGAPLPKNLGNLINSENEDDRET